MFAYIWEYTVKENRKPEFLAAYGPDGDWAQLFSIDSSFLGTNLLHDIENKDRFVTIDYWVSKGDLDAFKKQYSNEFASLDERCEEHTISEEFLGDFEVYNGPAT